MQFDDLTNVTKWYPGSFIDVTEQTENYAILLLNRPINFDKTYFKKIWNHAKLRVTVDGGTNHFVDFVRNNPGQNLMNPDLVTGDFDSCTIESMQYVQSLDCTIHKTPDQNATDFTKSLKTLKEYNFDEQIGYVLALCDTSGRFDQIIANINTLFLARKILPGVSVFIRSTNSISWILSPGQHVINIPLRLVRENIWCSLIPIGRPSTVTTRGLKWNLDNTLMHFGGMVSTSNTYEKNIVHVETDDDILWSMGTIPKDM